jgi:hypothetical protein
VCADRREDDGGALEPVDQQEVAADTGLWPPCPGVLWALLETDTPQTQTPSSTMEIPINKAAAIDKIERGSESVQWGKRFQVLEGLGVRVRVDVPESVAAYLNDLVNSKDKP